MSQSKLTHLLITFIIIQMKSDLISNVLLWFWIFVQILCTVASERVYVCSIGSTWNYNVAHCRWLNWLEKFSNWIMDLIIILCECFKCIQFVDSFPFRLLYAPWKLCTFVLCFETFLGRREKERESNWIFVMKTHRKNETLIWKHF